jgi:hypothetical protein
MIAPVGESARQAWSRGEAAFSAALEAQVRSHLAGMTEQLRDQVGAPGHVHAVGKGEWGAFHAAVAYGLWEEWGSIAPPVPCPSELIHGYAREEVLHADEVRQAVGDERSLMFARVITLSRVFERRLPMLAPEGDPTHADRLAFVLRDVGQELSELKVRYGIATGLAIRFLDEATKPGALPRDEWFAPITVEQAIAEWTRTPFWVDVVKVGVLDGDIAQDLGLDPATRIYALRDGTERDHRFTLFTAYGDNADLADTLRRSVGRFSKTPKIDYLDSSPAVHLWALSKLGFSQVLLGSYVLPVRYMQETKDFETMEAEINRAKEGTVIPRRS